MTQDALAEGPETEGADGYVLDDQIGFILRIAVQFHTAIFLQRMVGGLTQTQFATMAKLYEFGPCTQSDLGRWLQLDSATINGVVDRLRTRGLVTLTEDSADRRRQFVALTAEGRDLAERALPIGEQVTAATLSSLTPAEQTRLVQLLRKMAGQSGAAPKRDGRSRGRS